MWEEAAGTTFRPDSPILLYLPPSSFSSSQLAGRMEGPRVTLEAVLNPEPPSAGTPVGKAGKDSEWSKQGCAFSGGQALP